MMANHDIIVIGASMGGVQALSTLVAQFPADLPAAIFIVQHVSPEAPSMLADILSRAGPLPAKAAAHGEKIEQGRIYVAPPNRHLLVQLAQQPAGEFPPVPQDILREVAISERAASNMKSEEEMGELAPLA